MTQPPASDRPKPHQPAFWNRLFTERIMPWHAGTTPADLQRFAAAQPRPLTTLVPGCGHAYEAGWLAAQGWPVTALDFSPAAVDTAAQQLGDWPGTLVCADFFHYTPPQPPQLIYERAFLCALPPAMRQDWARRVAGLLPPGGLLAGYFYFGEQPKGPPYGIRREQLDALLTPAFALLEEKDVTDSVELFAGVERWMVWGRK